MKKEERKTVIFNKQDLERFKTISGFLPFRYCGKGGFSRFVHDSVNQKLERYEKKR